MRYLFVTIAVAALAGCAPPPLSNPEARTSSTPVGDDGTPAGADPEALATNVDPTDTSGTFRGFTVISLGDASVPGLWLETPLVDSEQPGRVVAENGRQIMVTLRPTGGERGSGSRLSLAGYQALGLSLTALPTVTVIADGTPA